MTLHDPPFFVGVVVFSETVPKYCSAWIAVVALMMSHFLVGIVGV